MFFRKIRAWWRRKRELARLVDPDISSALARDIGVEVTRVRLPSGAEIIVVKPAERDG